MSNTWTTTPTCFYCDKYATYRQITNGRNGHVVCNDHRYTEDAHPGMPNDCLFCAAGEPMVHNYEPPQS